MNVRKPDDWGSGVVRSVRLATGRATNGSTHVASVAPFLVKDFFQLTCLLSDNRRFVCFHHDHCNGHSQPRVRMNAQYLAYIGLIELISRRTRVRIWLNSKSCFVEPAFQSSIEHSHCCPLSKNTRQIQEQQLQD
jgi:hypothetical protein